VTIEGEVVIGVGGRPAKQNYLFRWKVSKLQVISELQEAFKILYV
jgi:hypothetical protein